MARRQGTKAEAIRASISELGGPDSAKNGEVIDKVKTAGFKASGAEISTYKSKMRKTLAAPMRAVLGVRPKAQGEAENGAFSGDAIKAVKAVVDQFGAHKVKALATLLG